ncbi:UDP-glucuronate 4-epimerase 2 [Bacteroides sp. 1_1_14]|nr:UDP-glucuronate 4-epimerase 2 [Bacteroides sp. 1_1_14]
MTLALNRAHLYKSDFVDLSNGTQSITDNDNIYIMLKSEERTQKVLLLKLNTEEQACRAAEKKVHDA